MKYSELYRLLRSYGCYDTGEGTNHAKYYSPITGKNIFIPRHKGQDVPPGILNEILKKAGVKK